MFSDQNIANKGVIGQLSFGLDSYPDWMTITKEALRDTVLELQEALCGISVYETLRTIILVLMNMFSTAELPLKSLRSKVRNSFAVQSILHTSSATLSLFLLNNDSRTAKSTFAIVAMILRFSG